LPFLQGCPIIRYHFHAQQSRKKNACPGRKAVIPDTSILPILEDICDWREKVVFPDLDAVDWEASAKADNGFTHSWDLKMPSAPCSQTRMRWAHFTTGWQT